MYYSRWANPWTWRSSNCLGSFPTDELHLRIGIPLADDLNLGRRVLGENEIGVSVQILTQELGGVPSEHSVSISASVIGVENVYAPVLMMLQPSL